MAYRDDLNMSYLRTSDNAGPSDADLDELANLPRSDEE